MTSTKHITFAYIHFVSKFGRGVFLLYLLFTFDMTEGILFEGIAFFTPPPYSAIGIRGRCRQANRKRKNILKDN